jgi:hypothetical protein
LVNLDELFASIPPEEHRRLIADTWKRDEDE